MRMQMAQQRERAPQRERGAAAALLALAGAAALACGVEERAQPVVSMPASAPEPAADWFPSRYGAGDRIGAANRLSPEIVRAAAGLVTSGRVYALGMEVAADTPAYPPRSYRIVITQSNDGTGAMLGSNHATGNDDLVMSYLGIGSQIDGLGHLGIGHRYYNGLHAKDFVNPSGLTQLGVESIPPIVTRGVLLNMAALRGVETVPAGTAYSVADIQAAAARQGIEIRSGDVVIFHSGWHAVRERDPARWVREHPGPGVAAAQHLAELGVVAVGADSAGLEVIPFENPNRPFEVHQTLLAKHGVYILENMVTGELAADGVHEFLFVLGQPKLRGAVQMVVNPIAIR
ncbi:MAG: cyclase family protein [Deltaproteobacteria bacterium]|nr:cyclase family protein [Deltaproteobacteria bacterium]